MDVVVPLQIPNVQTWRAHASDPPAVLSWLLKRDDPARRTTGDLATLERAARTASPESRGSLLNRCGDLCLAGGRREDALRYYGEAVDTYLAAGFAAPAAALCRKILRVSPASVRTHCTLACLAAHENEVEEARRRIDRFVDASRRAQTQRLAIARLRLAQEGFLDAGLRRHVAARLQELGDALGAQRIEAALREASPAPERVRGAWDRLLQAACADPDELWRYA